MARTSLAIMLILLSGTSLLPGASGTRPPAHEVSIVANLLAPMSAASAKVEGNTLVLSDLRDVEIGTQGRQLAGRVLLQADRNVLLALWVLRVGSDMARATPFLGHEGPGTNILRLGGARVAPSPVTFRRPVWLTLIPLDSTGAPRALRQVKIRQIRLIAAR